jgi:recombinational DNA repair protein RecR
MSTPGETRPRQHPLSNPELDAAALRRVYDILKEWQTDVDTCIVCAGTDTPCTVCLDTVRHIGAITGALTPERI